MPTRSGSNQSGLEYQEWGLIDYEEAHEKQMVLVERLLAGVGKETLAFCSHPPVVTLGRASHPEDDIQGWDGKVIEVQRGGKATYHGPGQAIGYPILNLQGRGSDLKRYLRYLENVIICTLRHYDVEADGDRKDATGVWVGPKKIASIGIGVKRWITFHGFAINLHRDPLAFKGINPCGFKTSDMVSLEELIGQKIPHSDFNAVLRAHFL